MCMDIVIIMIVIMIHYMYMCIYVYIHTYNDNNVNEALTHLVRHESVNLAINNNMCKQPLAIAKL